MKDIMNEFWAGKKIIFASEEKVGKDICKSQYKNVGKMEYKNVGFSTYSSAV